MLPRHGVVFLNQKLTQIGCNLSLRKLNDLGIYHHPSTILVNFVQMLMKNCSFLCVTIHIMFASTITLSTSEPGLTFLLSPATLPTLAVKTS